jgi:hypothetical protein
VNEKGFCPPKIRRGDRTITELSILFSKSHSFSV